MRRYSLFALIAVLAIIALAAGACGSKPTAEPTPVIPTSTPTSAVPTPTPVTLQIRVELDNFTFSPSTIVVPQGRPVEIILHSKLGEHSFTSDELHIDVPVDASSDARKTIRVDVAGNYVFYSKLPQDRARGMYGNLVVLPR